MAEKFFSVAAEYGDKTALICGDRSLSYRELATAVRTLAANLSNAGMGAGDVVAGQLPNALECPMLHFACNTIGAIYMPLHDSWREHELEQLLALANAKIIVCPGVYKQFDYTAMLTTIANNLPQSLQVYSLAECGSGVKPFTDLLVARDNERELIAGKMPDPDYPAALMLSGGTTSVSKISRFSSNNILAMIEPAAKAARLTENDIAAAIAPAGTGATGYLYPIFMPLMKGATAVILPLWRDPKDALLLLEKYHCSYAVAIPTQMSKMVPVLEAETFQINSLRCFANAGAPLPLETAVKIERYLECRIQSIYGSTDGGVPTMTDLDDADDKRLQTVGRVVDFAELKICDEHGNRLPPGEKGEIVWRCADKSWGYMGDDAQTKATFTEAGFYKSGDIGFLDEQGYLHITGRIKDMILRGGRNISPQAIEEPLMKHSAVLEVAVAAIPDPILGEKAGAFVVLREAASLDFETMKQFLLESGLAVWQLPEKLIILDDLPRGAGGKVRKSDLTDMAKTLI
ncbi:MAG: AMP-binding protein [Porticoccaceae bacterium]|nr:AMP-binding protein [Porticoccaceae bacterium]